MSDLEPTLWNVKGEPIAWQLGTCLVPATIDLTLSPERQREFDELLDALDSMREFTYPDTL